MCFYNFSRNKYNKKPGKNLLSDFPGDNPATINIQITRQNQSLNPNTLSRGKVLNTWFALKNLATRIIITFTSLSLIFSVYGKTDRLIMCLFIFIVNKNFIIFENLFQFFFRCWHWIITVVWFLQVNNLNRWSGDNVYDAFTESLSCWEQARNTYSNGPLRVQFNGQVPSILQRTTHVSCQGYDVFNQVVIGILAKRVA